MGDPPNRRATYDDVLAAPEGMTAEILAGELWLSPRPAGDHASVEIDVGADLREQFGRRRGGSGPGGWWILIEPELHLGVPAPKDVVAVPDVAGWRRDRMPVIPRIAAFTLPPDWVCEILSQGPRNTPWWLETKVPDGAQVGARQDGSVLLEGNVVSAAGTSS